MKKAVLFLSALLLAAGPLRADVITISLDGTTSHDGWADLTSTNFPGYGGFPGTGAWPGPIGSNTGGSGDAVLNKLANGTGGGPFPATDSIYFGGTDPGSNVQGGTLGVSDSTPVVNLETVVFQLQIGEATGYDLYNHVLPVLNYNGGSQGLMADFSGILNSYENGTFDPAPEPEPIYVNTWGLQWDLSGIAEPITSFEITFTGVQHAQIYALQLDQGDTFVQVIPEPSIYLMLGLGLVGLVWFRRFRNART